MANGVVALIEYGSGNLRSAEKALARAARENATGQEIVVTDKPDIVARAERIVLPGVGAFADCMSGLSKLDGMVEALNDTVIAKGRPFLGICVGMQLMARVGREFGDTPGLGWIDGEVVRLTPSDPSLKIPHMGWNELHVLHPHALTQDLAKDAHAYFVHSFEMRGQCRRCRGPHRLWRARHSHRRARQSRGHAIPSRKEPVRGPRAARQFPQVAPMILFPAIDLKDGQCVRLKRGAMDEATVFSDSPADQARAFADMGFEWLHCVDLNGAFEGRSVNAEAIRAIREAIDLPIQLGGGLRDMAGIEAWLEAGITRVILGTAALRDPALVKEAAKAFPQRIVVGIDARDGKVAVEGWAEISTLDAADLAQRFEDAGVAAIIFTDIARDGMLQGVNVEATAALSRAVRIPVIASGGVAGIGDVAALVAAKERNIQGVVIGRALYDGRIDAAEALGLARDA